MVFSSCTGSVTYIFYCIILVYRLSSEDWRSFKKNWKKKDIEKSKLEACYLRMETVTLKVMIGGTFGVEVFQPFTP